MDAELLERANRLARSYENDRDRIARLYANHPDRNDGRDLFARNVFGSLREVLLVGVVVAGAWLLFRSAARFLIQVTALLPDKIWGHDDPVGNIRRLASSSWTEILSTQHFGAAVKFLIGCLVGTLLLSAGAWVAKILRVPKILRSITMLVIPVGLLAIISIHSAVVVGLWGTVLIGFAIYYQRLAGKVSYGTVFLRVTLAQILAYAIILTWTFHG